jgi:flagellar biogenesis protein FliO
MGWDAIIATSALGAVCLLMWFLARIAKKRMGLGAGTVSQGALRVVGKRPIDQKSTLYVIEIAGGRHILIGSGTDGTVTKLDDISPDEYATMVDEPAAPKLRVARTSPAATDADAAAAEDGDVEAADAPRFATVGESFSALLGKARDARSGKRASGDE